MLDYLVFAEDVKGFSHPEYLVILLSFVYGISLSDQFFHLGIMLKRRRFYHETIIWTFMIMFSVIIYWYLLWRQVQLIDDSLLFFVSSFIPVFFIIGTVSLLYPLTSDTEYDVKATFLLNRKWIFLMLAGIYTSTMINFWYLSGTFTPLNYLRLVHIALLLLCAYYDNKPLRYAAATWFFSWYIILISYFRI